MPAPAAKIKNMQTATTAARNQSGSLSAQAKGVSDVSQNSMALQSSSVLQTTREEETLHSASKSCICTVLTTGNALGDEIPKGDDKNNDKVAPVDCCVHGLYYSVGYPQLTKLA